MTLISQQPPTTTAAQGNAVLQAMKALEEAERQSDPAAAIVAKCAAAPDLIIQSERTSASEPLLQAQR
jgi:hypothetical protein